MDLLLKGFKSLILYCFPALYIFDIVNVFKTVMLLQQD